MKYLDMHFENIQVANVQQHLTKEVEKFWLENTEISIIHLEATNKSQEEMGSWGLSDLPEAELESCSCSVVVAPLLVTARL